MKNIYRDYIKNKKELNLRVSLVWFCLKLFQTWSHMDIWTHVGGRHFIYKQSPCKVAVSLYLSLYSRACMQTTNFSHVLSARLAKYKSVICETGHFLTIWLKLRVQNSTLHRVVDTKCVRGSEEMSYISEQSSRSSFRKIQIFESSYFSLFRFKNHHCIELIYQKR